MVRGKLGPLVTLAGCPSQNRKAVGLRNSQWLFQGQVTPPRENHPCPVPSSSFPSLPLRVPPHSLHAPQPCLLSGGPAELLVTEAAHVRMLRVLYDLFYQPMADGGFFSLEELQNIFPSLDELIEVHCECRAVALRPTASSLLRCLDDKPWSLVSWAASVPALGTTPPP